MQEAFGGYDCDFVKPPPGAFQVECPICCMILRKPYQADCCGNNFCHTCVQQVQTNNTPCPTCREDNFVMFINKGLDRSLKQLKVYCTYREVGCQWRGELGELDRHLYIECKEKTKGSMTVS